MVSCVRAALLVALSTPPVALGRSRAQLPCVRPPCLSRAPRARRCAARAMPEPGKELPLKRSKSESLSEDEELLPFPSAPRAGRLLLPLLLAAYVHNQWSRSLIYYVVDFGDTDAPGSAQKLMNAELGFGPGTYSVLATIAFSALFAPLSLIAGSASDVGDRAFITWASLLGWSAATAWQGSAHSVWEVAASRSMQGVAQAFTTPAAYTLLADATPPARRGTVNSVYTTGVYIGGGLAALSIILDRALGWRGAEWAVAGVGGVTAIACAALLEDPREAARARGLAVASASSTDSTADAVRARIAEQLSSLQRTAEAVADSPATQLLLASAALRFCAGFSIAVWIGPWGRLVFPDREADFAVAKALISCLGGGFSVRAARSDAGCRGVATRHARRALRRRCSRARARVTARAHMPPRAPSARRVHRRWPAACSRTS